MLWCCGSMLKSRKLCEAEPVAAWFKCAKLLRDGADTAAMPIHGCREAQEDDEDEEEEEEDGWPGKLKEL